MWALVKVAVTWVFGDEILKYALYLAAGLLITATCQAQSVTHTLMAQPWGQYWGQVPQQAAMVAQPIAAPVPQVAAPVPQSARVATVIAEAMTWLNPRVPYLWGGCSRRGVDCSCFMQNIWATVGVKTPRTTTTQLPWTRPVPRDQIMAGDFLYWNDTCTNCGPNPTHVGLYLGDGRMIHAGDPVQIVSINTPYWQSKWHSAGRMPG